MKSDLRDFKSALKAVHKNSRHEFSVIVNKALKDVAFRAMQHSKFAEPGFIQAQLYRDNILLKMATRSLTGRRGKVKLDRFGGEKLTKRGRAQRFTRRVTRAQIAAKAAKILRARIRASKAVRAGWIPAVRAFGGAPRGAGPLRPGTAAKGYAIKANMRQLAGEIANTLVTRNHAGRKTPVENIAMARVALARAVDSVTRDREQFAQRRVESMLRRHSDF